MVISKQDDSDWSHILQTDVSEAVHEHNSG